MFDNIRIAVQGRVAAMAWKKRAIDLNERTQQTLDEAAKLLEEVNTFAEGTLIDELVDLGSTLMRATTRVMEGMNKIFDVVEGLLSKLQDLISFGSERTADTKSNLNA